MKTPVLPGLFDVPSRTNAPPTGPANDDLRGGPSVMERRFWEFHRDNPEVYDKLRELALQVYRAGHRHLGIRMLYERLRWYYLVETTDPDYKLNDHYHAFYARLLMRDEPLLRGFFETRGD